MEEKYKEQLEKLQKSNELKYWRTFFIISLISMNQFANLYIENLIDFNINR